MKRSKRIAALIAAVLMSLTMFSSAIPTYAAVPPTAVVMEQIQVVLIKL